MPRHGANSCSTLDLGGTVQVLHAQFQGRAFTPHWHEEWAIGLIVDGIESFEYQGATHRAGSQQVILMDAGEIHTGDSYDERGFAFQMLYVPASSFHEVAGTASPASLHFSASVMEDPVITKALCAFHRAQAVKAGGLQAESGLIESLSLVLQRASSWKVREESRPPAALGRARDLLHAHIFEDISLDSLAEVTGASKFHLLRAFRKQFGLTPHAYQVQQRVFHAKHLLTLGWPIAEIALRCGFADQSHLSRTFRSYVGVSPGQYAAQFSSIRRDR